MTNGTTIVTSPTGVKLVNQTSVSSLGKNVNFASSKFFKYFFRKAENKITTAKNTDKIFDDRIKLS